MRFYRIPWAFTGKGARAARRPVARSVGAWIIAATLLAFVALAGCEGGEEAAKPAPRNPPPYPELAAVERLVRDVRAILPALPARDVAPPAFELPPLAESAVRHVLSGTGRLVRAGPASDLPPSIRVDLYLDSREPPGGYLLVGSGAQPGERWPILSAHRAGDPGGDFTYTLRVADRERRIRYLTLLGLHYGSGGLRFRAFEGYLIFPGKGETLGGRPPIHVIDFGYRWPVPPRHEAKVARLQRDSDAANALRAQHEAGAGALERDRRARDALRSSAVPAEREGDRQRDLAAMETRLIGAAARQVELSRDLAEALLVLYRLRSEIAADWETFRENNPYRWMAPEQRRASFALLAGTRSLEQRWRAAYDAIEGDRRKALRSAREAMEAALLREIELEP